MSPQESLGLPGFAFFPCNGINDGSADGGGEHDFISVAEINMMVAIILGRLPPLLLRLVVEDFPPPDVEPHGFMHEAGL